MKKRFIIALITLLLLSTYNAQHHFKITSKFNIENIIIENASLINVATVKKKLSFLYEMNLIFLRNYKIEKELKNFDIIESFKIKKIYPNKVKIEIFEKLPIVIIQSKKEKKYFTSNGDIIEYFFSEDLKDSPIVFGEPEKFKVFYLNFKKTNFPLSEIKYFYFFESSRWNLVTARGQTIKLPIKDYDDSLLNFLSIKDKDNFRKYKIFDYRINNQLILK